MEDPKPPRTGMIDGAEDALHDIEALDAARRASGKSRYQAPRTARLIMFEASCSEEDIANYVRQNYFVTETFDHCPPAT